MSCAADRHSTRPYAYRSPRRLSCSSRPDRPPRRKVLCCRMPVSTRTSTAITGPDGLAITPVDVGVSWLPLYHDMGLIGMLLTAVYMAADVVILSPGAVPETPQRLARGDLALWRHGLVRPELRLRPVPAAREAVANRRAQPRQLACRRLRSGTDPRRLAGGVCRALRQSGIPRSRASSRATGWPSMRSPSRCRWTA